jgi:hypothetical protein
MLGIIESRFESSANLGDVCKAIEELVADFDILAGIGAKAVEGPDEPLKEGHNLPLRIKVNSLRLYDDRLLMRTD